MNATTAPGVFARSWLLLRANPAIVIPGLVVGAFAAILTVVLLPASDESPLGDLVARSLVGIVQLFATIVAIAYTTGMADAAWRAGRATFADGARAFRRDGGNVFVAMLALFVLGFAAAILAPLTLGFSLLVYVFFCIFTMAAAVVGERPGFVAVAESARIAFARPLPTALVVAGVLAVALGMGAVAGLLAVAPFVGPLVSAAIVQTVVAYVVLVLVGEYRLLRGVTPL